MKSPFDEAIAEKKKLSSQLKKQIKDNDEDLIDLQRQRYEHVAGHVMPLNQGDRVFYDLGKGDEVEGTFQRVYFAPQKQPILFVKFNDLSVGGNVPFDHSGSRLGGWHDIVPLEYAWRLRKA